MLYLVSTPIGHLGDMTYRAVTTLKEVDYILCEDTRVSRVLLNHYEISKPLVSFHKFNESFREAKVYEDLKEGLNIALISDAGTPGLSDPGEKLIKGCIEQNLPLTAIPGASALLPALLLSGLDTTPFQFVGFLHKKGFREALLSILEYPGTTILYESPHHALKLLTELKSKCPGRKIVIARELTKKFEEIKRGTVDELLAYFEEHPPRGEWVVLIEKETVKTVENLSLEEELAYLENQMHLTRKEALKWLAQKRQVKKSDLYRELLKPE